MPQGQKRKSAEEILGIQPRPGRKSAEEILGIAPQPTQESKADETSFWEDVKIGAERGYRKYLEPAALSLVEITEGMQKGDFQPLVQMGKEAVRNTYNALTPPSPTFQKDETGHFTSMQMREPDPVLREAQAKRDQNYQASPQGQRSKERLAELNKRASLDPSITGKVTRGISEIATGAAPTLGAAILSRGSLPITGLAAAAQSAHQPSQIGPNVAASVLPVPTVAPLLKRIRGGRSPKTPMSDTAIPETQPLPQLQGPSRPTQGLPQLIDENAPTIDLGIKPSLSPSQKVSMKGPGVDDLAALEVDPSLVTRAERTPTLETISALRKAGLLTGLKTHIKNVGGTGLFQLSEEASRIPSSLIDMTLSTITKQRTISGPSLQAMGRSAREAATKGFQEAKEIIRKGISADDLERLQLPREINSGSKILDGYVNGVFRLLNAEDRIFKTFSYRRALEDRARVMALNEMKQGIISSKEVMKRADDLVANPSESMVADSLLDSEIATFTNENLVSGAVGKGRDFLQKTSLPGGKAMDFGVDMAVPFVRTPTNIIARMFDYSPLGLIKGNSFKVAKALLTKAQITPEMQRQFSQSIGRASIGTGLIGLGWMLYDKGLMTGLIEDEPSKRSRDIAAGRIPGAILIDGRWHQVLGFSPLGSLMAIGATLARETKQDEERGLLPTLEVAGQAIGEQPLLIGSKQIAESLTKPGSVGEKTIGGLAGSFVPTIASDLAEAIDPQQRETKGEGIMGPAKKRIPFLRESLPESLDVIGQPKQDFGPGQAIVDPTRATTDVTQSNPIFQELVRLDAGISGFRQKPQETTQDYQQRVREFGKFYSEYGLQLLNSLPYKLISDDDRREVFKILNSRIKSLIEDEDQKEASLKLSPSAIFDSLTKRKENKKEKNN